MDRLSATRCRVAALVCTAASLLAVAASADPPRPQFESRLESPRTDAPVQADSIFASVVAAQAALHLRSRRGVARDLPAPSDASRIALDGDWRFRLEDDACDGGDQCQGLRERWFAPDVDDSAWRVLAVPGHFTRQIPVDELGGRASTRPFNFAWYRRRFTLPDSVDLVRQQLRLLFEAVDYRADVWLDGVQLNRDPHLGTFNPFAFALTPLATHGPHVLVVRVQRPLDRAILACGDGTGPATDLKTIIDGTKGYWDGRPGGNDDNFDAVTKQSLHTGGIVRPVALLTSGTVRIDWVFITALPTGDARARVLLAYTLTNLDDAVRTVTVRTVLAGPGLRAREGVTARVALQPGPNRFELTADLDGVAFWYPTGDPDLGGPAMYTATTTVLDRGAGSTRISDRRVDRFGIRTVGFTSDRCEDRFAGEPADPACADRFGFTAPRPPQGSEPERPIHQFFFNGTRIFLRGAGVDPDAWVAGIDRPFADRMMDLARRINANHLGVSVQIAPPVFYDAADDAGMAVVQDFELQWAYNDVGLVFACTPDGLALPTGALNPEVAAQTVDTAALLAADEIFLLYNHPSIAQWVMHNEPAWELAEVLGDYLPIIRALATWNQSLDRRLVAQSTAIDRTRPVKAAAGVGDTHIYSGFLLCSYFDLLGLDPTRTICTAESFKGVPFPSEFGTETWPFSAKRWLPPEVLFPSDREERRRTWTGTNPRNRNEVVPWLREWTYHASQPEIIATYVGSPADYDRFQDYAFATQLYQRAFLEFYLQHFRKDRFRPTAGLRLFHLRAYWDVAHFDIFDQYDLPSAAVRAVRSAYAPLLVTSQVTRPVFAPDETVRLPVWIVNERHRDVPNATLAWSIRAVDDAYVLRGVQDFPTPPYQDGRRAFLALAEALPPQPVVTTVRKPGAVPVGAALASGALPVVVPADSVSARDGATVIEFTAPDDPAPLRFYVLFLALRSGGRTEATNAHLIAVAAPGWEPPPGLSDGVTPYGTDSGDRPLEFALAVRGLGAGEDTVLETPAHAGAVTTVATARADANGIARFGALAPDEYVVRADGQMAVQLALTGDITVDVQ